MTALDDRQAVGIDQAVILAERAILGMALQNAAALETVCSTVGPDDYARPVHAHIHRAIMSLVGRGDPVDVTSVAGQLGSVAALPEGRNGQSRTLLDVVSGQYLYELTEAVTAGHASHHARTVADAGRRRRLVEALTRAARHAENPAAGLDEVIADHQAAMDRLTSPTGENVHSPAGRRARIRRAADIEIRPVTWAWDDRIPAGSLSIAAGREGTGKSSFGIWLTSQITRGVLPGAFYGVPRTVIYVAVEDSWEHTIAPRLAAAGADLERVLVFDVVENVDDEVTLSLPHDNQLLETEINHHDVALVVLDPLMSMIGSSIDTHKERDVRTALDPLARMANRTGAVLLGIAHFSKGNGSDVASLITGSGAFKNVARSVFGFARDDTDDTADRVMTQAKNSLGRDGSDLPSLAYEIEGAVIDTAYGPACVGRFRFTGESDRTVSDLLRGTSAQEATSAVDVAEEWLRVYLGNCAYRRAESSEIKAEAAKAGHKTRTLARARELLGVITITPSGFPRRTWWELPDDPDPQSCHGRASRATVPRLGTTGTTVAPLARLGTDSVETVTDDPDDDPDDSYSQSQIEEAS